ncbi:MAG: hypothetical protein GYA57_00565 [Myxococcales bacterium]|nr:hypothetical protein [Myxococcales bacterium]
MIVDVIVIVDVTVIVDALALVPPTLFRPDDTEPLLGDEILAMCDWRPRAGVVA